MKPRAAQVERVTVAATANLLGQMLVAEIGARLRVIGGVIVIVVVRHGVVVTNVPAVVGVHALGPDRPMDEPRGDAVHDEPEGRDVQHSIGAWARATRQVPNRFENDERRGAENEKRVENGGNRFGATQSEGEARGRVTDRNPYRKVRKGERRNVGEKVERLRSEHVAVGPGGTEQLDDEEGAHDREHHEDTFGLRVLLLVWREGARPGSLVDRVLGRGSAPFGAGYRRERPG